MEARSGEYAARAAAAAHLNLRPLEEVFAYKRLEDPSVGVVVRKHNFEGSS